MLYIFGGQNSLSTFKSIWVHLIDLFSINIFPTCRFLQFGCTQTLTLERDYLSFIHEQHVYP